MTSVIGMTAKIWLHFSIFILFVQLVSNFFMYCAIREKIRNLIAKQLNLSLCRIVWVDFKIIVRTTAKHVMNGPLLENLCTYLEHAFPENSILTFHYWSIGTCDVTKYSRWKINEKNTLKSGRWRPAKFSGRVFRSPSRRQSTPFTCERPFCVQPSRPRWILSAEGCGLAPAAVGLKIFPVLISWSIRLIPFAVREVFSFRGWFCEWLNVRFRFAVGIDRSMIFYVDYGVAPISER